MMACCGAAVLALTVSAAVWSRSASAAEPTEDGLYLGAGLAALSFEGVRFTDGETAGNPRLYDAPDFFDDGDIGTGIRWHLAVGRRLTDSLRGQLELGLTGSLDYRGSTNYRNSGDRQPSRATLSTRQFLLAGFHDFSPWSFGRGLQIRPYLGGGVGVTHYRVKDYVQSFPSPNDPDGYLRRGPDGEVPITRLPNGSGYRSTWMLTAGFDIPITDRIRLDLSYRYTDAGQVGTDVGDIHIVRYRDDGSRRDIPVRIDPTVTDLRTHALMATFRFAL